jgi:hypothetical protein
VAGLASFVAIMAASTPAAAQQQQQKRPDVIMLMTDDTGWNDFGAYSGGGTALGHPTPKSAKSRRKALYSRAGTAKRVAQRAAPHS